MSKQHGRGIDVKEVVKQEEVKVEPQIQQVEKLAEPTVSLTKAQIDALVEKRIKENLEIEQAEKTRLSTEKALKFTSYIDELKKIIKVSSKAKTLGQVNKTQAIYVDLSQNVLNNFDFNPNKIETRQVVDALLQKGETYQSEGQPFDEGRYMLTVFQAALQQIAKKLDAGLIIKNGKELQTAMRNESIFALLK